MSYLQLGLIRGRAYGIANESCDMAKDKIHKLMVSTGVVAALTSTEDALGGIMPVKNFDVGIGRLRIAQNRNEGIRKTAVNRRPDLVPLAIVISFYAPSLKKGIDFGTI